jgi:chromosome segregation protein
MFLRSLSIRGFKSFADKTVLEFQPGVSVIVGPNGSGKSNLVDAIAWVLGEQGPRAMRGGQMADVIFAGSPSRTALGMAEVKLVIDNSAGVIPVPMTEIEVSRAIFRSGESEYRIGGQVCRLLDVQELLAETGIGRALHTVVGQGQLEDVLMARPEDRRRYIEEAAGIAKHRKRKERAERKLSGLDQDLLRLQDVLSELRRQLKPLKQQAESAKRHEELAAQADQLAVRLASARLRDLMAERDRRTEGWTEGLERRDRARSRLTDLDRQVERAGERRSAATAALGLAETSFREAQSARTQAERAYHDAVEAEAAARSDLAQEASGTARIAALDRELAREQEELRATARELEERERALEAAEQEFRDAERTRRDAEDERRRLAEEAAARHAEMDALRRSVATYERERERLDESLSGVRVRIEETEAERRGLREEIERLDAQASPLAERRGALEDERRTVAQKVDELEDIVRRNDSRRELLEARRADVEETPGSRFLERHGGRAVGLLRDLVRIQKGYEPALLAALGAFADAVVYEDGEAALADAHEGDGAILAIASGGPVPFKLADERSLLSAIVAEPAARGIVGTVLGNVYLAGSVDEAAEKHRRHPKASFVTPRGVLVGPAVIHTAARASERSREIRAELSVVDHDLQAARNALRPKSERLDEISGDAAALDEEIRASDAEITSAAERRVHLSAELGSLRKEDELLSGRLAGLDDAAAGWRASLAGAGSVAPALPDLPLVPEAPLGERVAVETLRRELRGREQRLHDLRSEREQLAELDPAALRSALSAAEEDRAQAELRVREAEEHAEAVSAARGEAVQAERDSAESEAAANKAWRDAAGELERLREEYEDEDRLRGDLDRRIREAERLLREGLGAEPQEALSALGPEDTVEGIERRAQLVQRRLALIGRVNLLAGGEFEALQERHDFLARELDDVKKARRDLLQVIARIDEEITQTFDAAFRDVAAEFERLIKELFPGGEGRIVLTDPAEPLTSGIEIEARPGRKRVKRISLLSGGERALTAMAFLFSIFTARPSPFYLMDEVEPALDDVNLHRFLTLVRGFAERSQVLIVTHQKRTMEIAGMMYGVSMSKGGTSTVIGQRLEVPAGTDPKDAPPSAAEGASRAQEDPTVALPEADEPIVVV